MPRNHDPVQHTPAADHLASLLHTTIETASDDEGWAALSHIGDLLTRKHPDFDSRNYGYSKLGDLISALPLFDVIRHSPREGKPKDIYVRDKRRGGGGNAAN